IRCLGSEGIPTVAMDYSEEDRYGAASKYCDEKLIVPHYRYDTEKFIDALIDFSTKQELKPVLIPCHDSYLEVIDAYLHRLKDYYHIPQTQQGLYAQVMNKDTLAKLAMEHGAAIPETVHLDDEDFYHKVEKTIKFPCLVKPVDSPSFMSVFRKKLFKVHDMDELQEAVKRSNDANLEVIIQRIIPGFDDHMYTFDAHLNQDAKITHWVTGRKLRQYPINFGASVYTIQKYTPELYDLGASFLESIQYKGFAEIEFKKDANTGDFYIIEINARITNFNEMLRRVGMNFPYIVYREMIGEPLEPKAIEHETNVAFQYGYEDLLAIKDYIKTKQLSVGTVVKSLFRKKVPAIWAWNDMKPGYTFVKTRVSKIFSKVFKK